MRAFLFSITFLSAILLPYPFFAGLCLLYVLCYRPWELFIIAILVDAHYGEAHVYNVWYLYTLTVAILLVLSEALKPHLKFYSIDT